MKRKKKTQTTESQSLENQYELFACHRAALSLFVDHPWIIIGMIKVMTEEMEEEEFSLLLSGYACPGTCKEDRIQTLTRAEKFLEFLWDNEAGLNFLDKPE